MKQSPLLFKERTKLYDIVVIRPIAMVLVVAFHAYSLLMHEAHFPETREVFQELYYKPFCLVLNFHMPLFIFISGYLFSYLEGGGKYQTFIGLVQNKFKRLIIPYFVFSTLIMLSFNNFSIYTYVSWDYWHLWFIPMLFWCFFFTKVMQLIPLCRTLGWNICILCIFMWIPAIDDVYIPKFIGLHLFLKWYIWFYVGYHVFNHRTWIYEFIDKKRYLICSLCLLIFCLVSWYKCSSYNDGVSVPYIFKWISNLSIVILIWYIVNLSLNLYNADWVKSPVLACLNKYSYGIYIFHFWVQPFMISSTAKRLFGLEAFADEHIILFPFLYFVLSYVVSLIVTHFFLKTKIGQFLIG